MITFYNYGYFFSIYISSYNIKILFIYLCLH